jgi:hypothetical protein
MSEQQAEIADSIPNDIDSDMGNDSFFNALLSDESTDVGSSANALVDTPEANPTSTTSEPTPNGDGQQEAAELDSGEAAELTFAEMVAQMSPEEQEIFQEKFQEFLKAHQPPDENAEPVTAPEAPKVEDVQQARTENEYKAELERINQIAELYRPLTLDDDTTDPDFMNEYLTARDAATLNEIPKMMTPVVAQLVVNMMQSALPAAFAEFVNPNVKGKSNEMLPLVTQYFKENPKGSFRDAAEYAAEKLEKDLRVGNMLTKLNRKAPVNSNGTKPTSQRGVGRSGSNLNNNQPANSMDALLNFWKSQRSS